VTLIGGGDTLLGDLSLIDEFILFDLLLIGEWPLSWYYDLAAGIGCGLRVRIGCKSRLNSCHS